MFSTSQESDVGGIVLSLEQSFPLKMYQSVLPCSSEDPDHLVRYCLVDVEYIFEQH